MRSPNGAQVAVDQLMSPSGNRHGAVRRRRVIDLAARAKKRRARNDVIPTEVTSLQRGAPNKKPSRPEGPQGPLQSPIAWTRLNTEASVLGQSVEQPLEGPPGARSCGVRRERERRIAGLDAMKHQHGPDTAEEGPRKHGKRQSQQQFLYPG